MQIRNVKESDFDPIISVLDTWFEMEPAIEESGDIPVHINYDGPGEDRVLLIKRL